MPGYRGRGGQQGAQFGNGSHPIWNGHFRVVGADRYCYSCKQTIHGQANLLLSICPRNACGATIPLTQRENGQQFRDSDGWGRCLNCKAFMHRSMPYCEACQYENHVGMERKKRRETASLKKNKFQQDAKIARLEREKEELLSIIAIKGPATPPAPRQGDDFDDDMDRALSQIVDPVNGTANVGQKPGSVSKEPSNKKKNIENEDKQSDKDKDSDKDNKSE